MPRPLRVFLCHASQDKPAVRKLHRYLKQHGIQPWLDQEDLLPGENWEVEIPRALNASDVILVCLSKNSVNKEGYVQKEISFALDKALEKPDGTIFIIPAKLEDCDVPKRLNRFQWVDLFRPDSNKRLLLGLNKRVASLGPDVSPVILEDTRQKISTSRTPKLEKTEEQIVSASVLEEHNEEYKKEIPVKPFTKILDPSALSPRKTLLIQADKQYEKKRLFYRLGGFALVAVFVLGLYTFFPLSPEQNKVTLTAAFGGDTEMPQPLAESSATFSSTPQSTETIIPTPTLGIGSTIIGEKGETLVYVPVGKFTMGNSDSDAPVHTVYLNAYWLDQTEVTNKQYKTCVNAGVCEPPSSTGSYTHTSYYEIPEFDNYPVLYVTWDKANRYCEVWTGGDLPTEAQWEKAARGTDARTYPWGNSVPANNLLNYNSNVGDTTEVGAYPSGESTYGVYDMAGNVWEWVNDWYGGTYYDELTSSNNPVGPESGQFRVLRGGSWLNQDYSVRSANRGKYDPSYMYSYIGFRCARSP
ncbi:MAG: SUMF1/EgtB/PvdO family nonheme iron enzyme [Anaerolineales bacterium]